MSEFARHLAAAKDGDEAAFVVLFQSVQPSLLRYLRTMSSSSPMVEDVAAETWVSVVKSLHRFRGDEAGWRAWVFTIGRARLRDAQRAERKRPSAHFSDEVLLSEPAADDVSGSVDEILSTEAALSLVRSLPRDQAEVVLLRYVAGLDVGRTAKVLGKTPGAVRVAAHRGLRRLAEMRPLPSEDIGRRLSSEDIAEGGL